ncbi:MAG: hypothetical protein AB7N80_02170 [Bdellovibrionales bacterium]
MNLDDIKDQLRDQLNALWGRIQESTAFNTLKEQYDSWPTIAQRTVAFSAGFVGLLIVLSIPFSYIGAANTSIEEFNEYRGLLRDLLRVGRSAKDDPPLPPGLSAADLQNQVQGMMGEFALLPEQVGPIRPLEDRPAASLAQPVIQQNGIAVALKKLNLNQILDIGFRLQNISGGTKLTGIEILANREDNHYYDVTYKVVNFSLPLSAGGEDNDR